MAIPLPRDEPRAPRIPGDVILEPEERVLVATRPLYLWEPLALLWLLALAFVVYGYATGDTVLTAPAVLAFALLTLFIGVRWMPWSQRWYILTDRRVIARWGVFNRHQAAELLDRVQDASLSRPFPLSMVRDYGVIQLETAGEHAESRISGGLDELRMTGASRFYRALTDALTPNR